MAKQTKGVIAKATRDRYQAKQNSFSVATAGLRKANMIEKPEVTAEDKTVVRGASRSRRSWEGTPSGQERLTDGVGQVRRLNPDGSQGEATTLSHVMGHAHAYALGMRGAYVGHEQYRAALPHLLGPSVPDLNEPHHVPETVVPQRRWEDLHPHEQARTLAAAARWGVTPGSAKRDYAAQLDQAHQRAFSAGHASTYTSHFYSGPSEPHDRISVSAEANAQHPQAQAAASGMKVSMRDVQAIANSITSPRTRFSRVKNGQTVFPNDEFANTAIQHVLNNPHMSAHEAMESVPNNTGPSGGGLHGNIKRAAFAAHQLIYGGETPRTLRNPADKKAAREGRPGTRLFGTPKTQKTTAYASAWMQPDHADAFLTTDVHTGHGFAAHLGTAKEVLPDNPRGGKSDVEKYIEEVPNVHAFHDHIARQVHAERGLSPSVNNTRFLHRGQAAQWGEERIQRPDLTDATHDSAYGRPAREMGQSPAAPHLTAAAEQPQWTMGDQKRHENTVAKRRREGRLTVDPEARAQGW